MQRKCARRLRSPGAVGLAACARRATFAWAIALAIFARASAGRAEEPKHAPARLHKQASVAHAEGRYSDSRDAWLAIWKIEGGQVAACNIGALSYRIGDAPSAVRWLSLCKEIMREPKTAVERAVHDSRLYDLARARLLVGELRIVVPAGAAVTIDDRAAEVEDGAPMYVAPGRHVVRASLNGISARVEVDIPRGEAREVKLDLSAPPPVPPVRPTPLSVAAKRAPTATPGPRVPVVLGGIAAATVFSALGGGLMVLSAEAHDDAIESARAAGPNRCFRIDTPECAKAVSYEEDMYRAREAGIASFVVGGVLAAATVVYVVYPRQRAEIAVSARGVAVKSAW